MIGTHQGRPFRRVWGWRRSELVDAAQNVGEQVFRDGDLGHLERDIAAMAEDIAQWLMSQTEPELPILA